MLLIDAALRFGCLTLLVLMAALAFRDTRHLLQGKLAFAACFSLGAMFISTMPAEMGLPFGVKAVAWLIHIPNTPLLWLFGLSLFDDQFKLRRFHIAVIVASFAWLLGWELSGVLDFKAGAIAAITLKRCTDFSVLAHLLWTAFSGRRDDLVEERRRTRLWFTAGVAVSGAVIIGGETVHLVLTHDEHDPRWLAVLRSGVALPMILFSVLWFLRMPASFFLFESVSTEKLTETPSIDPRDQVTHARLISAMDEENLYREQGLSIGALAERLKVPEHQLRALINKGLGYRNFSEFLNHYRLGDAKADLSDPEKARLPILTIAMDAGYASLATFNRAFKSAVGKTPSEFRNSALLNATAQS